MPNWYFDKKDLRNTPSLADNIDYDTEMRYRREGARFIIDTGTKMELGYNTTATGVVYFHRFYMYHSFKSFPRYVTACCCLFLAGKVEETPKKCRDIIYTVKNFLSDEKFLSFGEDPKEEVMTLERILLQTIKFDLQVEHPYTFLLKYAKSLKGDKTKLHKMVQMAWTFVNDSLCTTLCLQWEPEIIAVALMYLAGKLSKFEVVDWAGRTGKHLRWWDVFIEDVSMDLLEDICHQVLDLYSQPQGKANSPPLSSRKSTGKFSDYSTTSPNADMLKEVKKGKHEVVGNNKVLVGNVVVDGVKGVVGGSGSVMGGLAVAPPLKVGHVLPVPVDGIYPGAGLDPTQKQTFPIESTVPPYPTYSLSQFSTLPPRPFLPPAAPPHSPPQFFPPVPTRPPY